MPRALDPQATFEVVLESDKAKPEASRPTFVFRVLNGRDWRKAVEKSDLLSTLETAAARLDAIYDAIRVGLTGWRGMIDPKTNEPIAFEPSNLDLLLDNEEAWELYSAMMTNGRLSADDKKKSDSQP